MIFSRVIRPQGEPGWHDEPGDPLVVRLEALASAPVDVAARVDRRRDALLATFERTAASPSRPRLPARTPGRLAYAFATAVILVALAAGGIAASRPGLPMYGVRLAAEELLLPAGGVDRMIGQLDRLDRRLDEASRAVAAHDTSAASAALQAYDGIASALLSGSPPPVQDRVPIVARLRAQLEQLERIRSIDPLSGPDAAIRSANAVLAWLSAPGYDGAPFGPPGAGHSPGPSPSPGPMATPRSNSATPPSPGSSGASGPGGAPAPGASPGSSDFRGSSPGPSGALGPSGSPGHGGPSGAPGSDGVGASAAPGAGGGG